MQGKVEICGVNTSRLHVLSQVEMDALLRRAQAGDEDAREKLIEGNLRLVLSVIQRFDKRGENPDDLFQVGCIGLIKAISNFDPDKQVRFSTYGVPMIAGEVRRYLRDNSVIRVSRSIRDVAYRVLQCKEALITRLGREPTLEEISKELEIPLEEVSRALDAVCAPASLYDPVYSDGGDPLTVMDQVRDTKNTEDGWMEHITLQNAFRALNDREKQILSLRFYDGKTQMEVASALGHFPGAGVPAGKGRHWRHAQVRQRFVEQSYSFFLVHRLFQRRVGLCQCDSPSCNAKRSSASATGDGWDLLRTCRWRSPAGTSAPSSSHAPRGFRAASDGGTILSFPGTASSASARTSCWWRRSPTTAGCREESRGCQDSAAPAQFFSPPRNFFVFFRK